MVGRLVVTSSAKPDASGSIKREVSMWKETVVRMLIGISGTAIGALFVVWLHGAARADEQQLHIAHSAALAAAALANEELVSLAARSELPPRRVP
jgi:hypothetical protein